MTHTFEETMMKCFIFAIIAVIIAGFRKHKRNQLIKQGIDPDEVERQQQEQEKLEQNEKAQEDYVRIFVNQGYETPGISPHTPPASSTQKPKKMYWLVKFALGSFIAVVVFFVYIFATSDTPSNSASSVPSNNQNKNSNKAAVSDDAIEKMLLETSKGMNKNLPVMVDSETRADITLVIGKQFHYKNTLVNLSKKEIDTAVISNQVNKIAATHCNDEKKKELLRLGITYHFTYLDKNGDLVSTSIISIKNCN